MAILTHSGGPASSMADACNRWGLKVPIFSENLQERIRQLLPATASFRNPVDLTFFMNMDVLLEKIPQILLEDQTIDGLLLHGIQGSSYFLSISEIAQNRVRVPPYEKIKGLYTSAMEAFVQLPKKYGKPVITSAFADRQDDSVVFVQDRQIPCYRAPERAVRAMAALCQYAEIRSRA